ncbi:hypothetical protein GGS20DRAFT_590293 [Poronia punctata]|nr:hypothetical protein GGS20DRAFT_590293 [Poronia punctata]
MDRQPAAADSNHHYSTQIWTRSISSPAVPRLSTLQAAAKPAEPVSAQCATHFDLVPILIPQQPLYQAKLDHYNKLIAPGRGGGLQTSPLPPLLSQQPVHAGSRSRSLSKVSNKDSRPRQSSQNCHGNRSNQNNQKADRLLITGKVANSKMAQKKPDANQGLPPKPKMSISSSHLPPHSSSVPSTPHQHARKFSYGSRDQSPGANASHSPRSVYSETNSGVPSLRPLPPRGGGCKYETGLKHMKRRVPYSIGTDLLERLDLSVVRSKLSEDDERKLTTDMRELYDRLQPTQDVEKKRQRLVQKLEKLMNDTWPGHDIRVHLFGSSGNLLCSDDSDVDICIVTPWKELEGICMLADLLAKHGMEKVVCVASAKVPIVKIWDPELELSCDMNVNNTLALENTRMIRTYVEIDERVRPLAMVIKYWTRRRILNDAAFGGTLSSYTWMCMIIAFLQLREPPVLPALHQRALQNPSRKDGQMAAFADDVENLRGFGDGNKSTLGELLFQFFRFFAHEFDYSSNVLSVRLGKLFPKHEKKWHLALNNQLCVEEPFNTGRNLGNTADDTAFRGIHLELRRAFDLIAQGNLAECCEQFVYPKEEERIFHKPPVVSRPVLLRSASQQASRPSRGGTYRSGNRHQSRNNGNNNNNSSNSNNNSNSNSRRASSGLTYENSLPTMFVPAAYAMALGAQDGNAMYIQPPELAAQLSALQLQENNLRFLQYTQSQAFAQQQALQHAQRMQGTAPQGQSSADRSRTNSFDTPPLSAPGRPDIRPEMYYYPVHLQHPHALYGYPAYQAVPSNLNTAEYRRPSHRSPAANETSHGSSGSAIRSQSQPASRNMVVHSAMPNGMAGTSTRLVNGAPIPSFLPDESTDTEQSSTTGNSPDEVKGGNYYTHPSSPRTSGVATNGLLAFGDIGPHAGSTDEAGPMSGDFVPALPNNTTSRSSSPNNMDRPYSRSHGSLPLSSISFSPRYLARETAPLVVNGSSPTPPSHNSPRYAWHGEPIMPSELNVYENPLHTQRDPGLIGQQPNTPSDSSTSATSREAYTPVSSQPVVVNGTSHPSGLMTPPRYSQHFATNDAVTQNSDGLLNVATWPTGPAPGADSGSSVRLPPSLSRLPRSTPSPLIAQLDLATENKLSPVYEASSASPSFARKPLEVPSSESPNRISYPSQKRREIATELGRNKAKLPVDSANSEADVSPHSNPRVSGLLRESGHVRGVKSESDNVGATGAWQKSRGRKRVNDLKGRSEVFAQSEQPPKHDADRKGG